MPLLHRFVQFFVRSNWLLIGFADNQLPRPTQRSDMIRPCHWTPELCHGFLEHAAWGLRTAEGGKVKSTQFGNLGYLTGWLYFRNFPVRVGYIIYFHPLSSTANFDRSTFCRLISCWQHHFSPNSFCWFIWIHSFVESSTIFHSIT